MYVKRKYPRFSVSGVVELVTPGGRFHLSGMIEKISRGGVGIYSNERLEKGTPVDLDLIMFTGPDTSSFRIKGKVQNFEVQKESGLLGIQFDKIIDEVSQGDLYRYLALLEKQYSKYKAVL